MRTYTKASAGVVPLVFSLVTTMVVTPSFVSAATENVAWTSLVNAVVVGTTLRQSGCDGCVGGGISAQNIVSGDGYVEFTVAEVATQRTAGLSNGNTDTKGSDIDFGIAFNGAGSAEVRESGIYRWDTSYASGDVFRVGVVGGQVEYSKNGVVFYTSATLPTYPLLVDSSLAGVGSTISNAIISGALSGGSGGPDTTPPLRSNGRPTGALPFGTTTTTASLSTDEAATCRYATTAGVSMQARPRGTQPSPRLTRKRCQACLPPRRITTGSDHGMPRTIWRYRVMGP